MISEKGTPVYKIAHLLGDLSTLWLKKDFSFRKKTVKRLIQKSYFTKGMSEAMLDGLFRELTAPKLLRLLKTELKDPLVLDKFRRDPVTGHSHRARGPELITHIFAGNVPNPAIISFVLGMLVKSSNVGKCSSEDAGFLDIYLDSLNDFDKKLGDTNTLIDPRNKQLLSSFIQKSDLVVAYGSDETLAAIQKQIPHGKTFIGYGHRASFIFLAREALQPKDLKQLAKQTARDLWMMDGRGCLSPVIITVEKNRTVSLKDFSNALVAEIRKMDFHKERLFQLKNKLNLSQIQGGFLREIKNRDEFYKILSKNRSYLQCVALESPSSQRKKISEKLSDLGVNRICRVGQMQFPPLTWHHDGKLNLANWLRWTDLEM